MQKKWSRIYCVFLRLPHSPPSNPIFHCSLADSRSISSTDVRVSSLEQTISMTAGYRAFLDVIESPDGLNIGATYSDTHTCGAAVSGGSSSTFVTTKLAGERFYCQYGTTVVSTLPNGQLTIESAEVIVSTNAEGSLYNSASYHYVSVQVYAEQSLLLVTSLVSHVSKSQLLLFQVSKVLYLSSLPSLEEVKVSDKLLSESSKLSPDQKSEPLQSLQLPVITRIITSQAGSTNSSTPTVPPAYENSSSTKSVNNYMLMISVITVFMTFIFI
ncbi:hypothetical protein DFJ63DRAFT_315175 [Scheffersomyces coipomensis]|uniref:uncharacterized protein n=1 Tax=Scheffersomyces coipomensis TaxID=1788519 RepID=UPI00315D0A93